MTTPDADEAPASPAQAPSVEAAPGRWLVAPLAATVAAVIGLLITAVPVVGVWLASGPQLGQWAQPLRTTGLAWVATHDIAVRAGSATYSLLPLGFLLLWGALCLRAGHWAARAARVADLRHAVFTASAAAASYAALLTLMAWATATPEAAASPLRALGIGLAFALVAFGIGVLRGARLGPALAGRTPDGVRVAARAALAGVAALLGAGAVLLAGALALHAGDLMAISRFLDAGWLGGLVLLVISLGYLPVAIIWSTSYLLGAGLSLGGATVLSPFVATPLPTQLPPLPLLAALPGSSGPAAWGLPVLGVLAGVLMGAVVARHARGSGALVRLAVAVGAVAMAAVGLAILARMSFGSFGDVRLVGLGPSSQLVALLAGATLLVGAVPAGLALGRRRPSEPVLAAVPADAGEATPGADVTPEPGAEPLPSSGDHESPDA